MPPTDPSDAVSACLSALPSPLSGTTLVLGPSNVGKTTLTARLLERWVDEHGHAGVVVLDFGPEVERDGAVLGGRLDRFTEVLRNPEGSSAERFAICRRNGLWYGVIDAHAPRAEGETASETLALAEENATAALALLDRAPAEPRAVFVNDATIALHHPVGETDRLLTYCARAEAAVLNAFESDELGTDDAVSRQERAALAALEAGADTVCRLAP